MVVRRLLLHSNQCQEVEADSNQQQRNKHEEVLLRVTLALGLGCCFM